MGALLVEFGVAIRVAEVWMEDELGGTNAGTAAGLRWIGLGEGVFKAGFEVDLRND